MGARDIDQLNKSRSFECENSNMHTYSVVVFGKIHHTHTHQLSFYVCMLLSLSINCSICSPFSISMPIPLFTIALSEPRWSRKMLNQHCWGCCSTCIRERNKMGPAVHVRRIRSKRMAAAATAEHKKNRIFRFDFKQSAKSFLFWQD